MTSRKPVPGLDNICVYCGSGSGHDPAYVEAAREFGRILAKNGVGLVYGGGNLGLMGEIARTVLHEGGHVTGIIPSFLSEREHMLLDVQELHVVEDMHQRKRLMFLKSDAFVAFPGGLGTLEEFVEQLTWSQLGRHNKPIVLANIEGFWDPLLGLIAHMRALALVPSPAQGVNLLVADRIEDILPKLREAARAVVAAEQKMAVPADRM